MSSVHSAKTRAVFREDAGAALRTCFQVHREALAGYPLAALTRQYLGGLESGEAAAQRSKMLVFRIVDGWLAAADSHAAAVVLPKTGAPAPAVPQPLDVQAALFSLRETFAQLEALRAGLPTPGPARARSDALA
jgi:hypothetical protein